MEKWSGLYHLFVTYFLHSFSSFMVTPAITDVTMAALCPGEDECSLAIYLTGFQQVVIGLGTFVVMPIVGELSDVYGRKSLITIPMCLNVIPFAILAYRRTKGFFYSYFILKTITAMVGEGSVHCLALAYATDNVSEQRRATAFGFLSGIGSAAFLCGNIWTRFLSTPQTFQIAAAIAVVAVFYLRILLPESSLAVSVGTPLLPKVDGLVPRTSKLKKILRALPSTMDMISMLKSRVGLSEAAVVAFFNSVGEVGLHTSLTYYLKARFHFDKDQFADLMIIAGIAGALSQFLVLPALAPSLGERRLLSIGLFFSFTHMFLYSIAWSFWVPYLAAMCSVFIALSQPSMRTIVSKQVGPDKQGKAQGSISGICCFANFLSPFIFSPLTALFLSSSAPFPFPGFSILCVGFAPMIAFIQSLVMRDNILSLLIV